MIASKTRALKMLVGLAQGDSIIQAFGDIFVVLSLGLVISAFLVLFIKGTKANSDQIMIE